MKKIPVDGGAAEQIQSKGASGYTAQIALDATSVYWATSVPGAAKVFRLTPR